MLWVGCSGSASDEPVSLAFTSPAPGAGFVRDQLGATGALVAQVPVTVDVGGAPARVGLAAGEVASADLAADGIGVADVATTGAATIVATAYGDDDAVLATASVDITVADASPADCHAHLALYQIEFTDGPVRDGVADPVTATVPINGVSYRYVENADPRQTLFGDCALILSLAKAAPLLRARDIVEVADIGVYNYRCIGGGTPPDCPNGISQHAYAKAIDLAGFTDSTGTYASVNDDWIIDPDSEDTCAAATEPGKDTFLHELICALKAAGTWNIVLTPNYNADHRNHFHVDLTPDADFLERRTQLPD
ncbi:MAG TPA: extensin family protein [Kofleriaceae bacterium]|nr:extensin family protein [Kofleriaceae bacterium]